MCVINEPLKNKRSVISNQVYEVISEIISSYMEIEKIAVETKIYSASQESLI